VLVYSGLIFYGVMPCNGITFFILYRDRNLLNNVRERKLIIAEIVKIYYNCNSYTGDVSEITCVGVLNG